MVRNPEEHDQPRSKYGGVQRWATAVGLLSALASFAAGILSDTRSFGSFITGTDPALLVAVVTAAVFSTLLVAAATSMRLGRRADLAAARSREAFREAAAHVITSVEQDTPAPEASLEDELSDVSASLATAVARLRRISVKAEAFEAEVQGLVARADAAKAAASLHEDDARRIARLLGAESETHLRDEIGKLTAEYNRQIDELRRSGSRTALWTFIGGVVLGIAGNIVVALWMG